MKAKGPGFAYIMTCSKQFNFIEIYLHTICLFPLIPILILVPTGPVAPTKPSHKDNENKGQAEQIIEVAENKAGSDTKCRKTNG
jgi:hypothetical protein